MVKGRLIAEGTVNESGNEGNISLKKAHNINTHFVKENNNIGSPLKSLPFIIVIVHIMRFFNHRSRL
jgi:hypothetical protein